MAPQPTTPVTGTTTGTTGVTTAERLALMQMMRARLGLVQASAHPAAATPTQPLGDVRITGRLLADAQVRVTSGADPQALLLLEVNTGAGMPFSVQQPMGSGFAAHLAAHSKARQLRQGATVTVTCAGAYPRTDHGEARMVCLRVLDVVPHQLPAVRGGSPD